MPALLISFLEWLSAWFGPRAPAPPTELKTLRPRILQVTFNPIIPSEGGRKLTEVMGWHDPTQLANDYIKDLKEVSFGLYEPDIIEHVEVNEWPVKQDSFVYDDNFVQIFRGGDLRVEPDGPFHTPDAVDYALIIRRFDILNRVSNNTIDEVWMFGFPFAGFEESTMGGRDAFKCNAGALPNTGQCPRKFVVMGFNYERGVGEMLESFGHRCEDIMGRVYRRASPPTNMWNKFIASCGTVHCGPNSEDCGDGKAKDREWDNPRTIQSDCDDWFNYPNFTGAIKPINCEVWGCNDSRQHHLWWLRHFPHVAGAAGGISNNWWNYVGNPNMVS